MRFKRSTQVFVFAAILLLAVGGLLAWVGGRFSHSDRFLLNSESYRSVSNQAETVYLPIDSPQRFEILEKASARYQEFNKKYKNSKKRQTLLAGQLSPQTINQFWSAENQSRRAVFYSEIDQTEACLGELYAVSDPQQRESLDEAAAFLAQLSGNNDADGAKTDSRQLFCVETMPEGNPLNSLFVFSPTDLIPIPNPTAHFLQETAVPASLAVSLLFSIFSMVLSFFQADSVWTVLFPDYLRVWLDELKISHRLALCVFWGLNVRNSRFFRNEYGLFPLNDSLLARQTVVLLI